MTTAELIAQLRELDPSGEREVGMFIDPSNEAIGHIRLHNYTPGLAVLGWDTEPVASTGKEKRA